MKQLLYNYHTKVAKMGTQFSKIKVTSRIEVHGQVYTQYAPGLELDYPVKSNSTNDLSEELYTRRAHHR